MEVNHAFQGIGPGKLDPSLYPETSVTSDKNLWVCAQTAYRVSRRVHAPGACDEASMIYFKTIYLPKPDASSRMILSVWYLFYNSLKQSLVKGRTIN